NQFDGLHFEHHVLAERVGVAGSNVRMLLASRGGGLWVLMDGSVVFLKLNCAPQVFRDKISPQRPESMVEDDQGALWIGYRAPGQICRIKDRQVTIPDAEANIPPGASHYLSIEAQGRLWFAAGDQVGLFRGGRF